MARLADRYKKEIVPKLTEKLGRANVLSLPRLRKIVVNMGVGKALQDKNRMEQSAEQLTQIVGQRAQVTKAKVSISQFRLREGQEIILQQMEQYFFGEGSQFPPGYVPAQSKQ
jgi:large subunit ribosomal protein L5